MAIVTLGNQFSRRFPDGGGAYRVRGSVTVNGVTSSRQVLLFKRGTAYGWGFMREIYSAGDGSYAFDGLAQGNYMVVGLDPSGTYNAIVHDHIQAEPMPA